jgi:hypothetical protein
MSNIESYTLSSLPAEILILICGFLQDTSTSLRDLKALSLMNRTFQAVTRDFVYHATTLRLADFEQQEDDIRRLKSTGLTGSINHLIVIAPKSLMNHYSCQKVSCYHEAEGWLGDCCPPNTMSPGIFKHLDSYWEPLATFITQLPKLTDFTFDSSYQLPACILRTLETQIPTCRLHMRPLYFRSLVEDRLDSHELAIATSPSLYSVAAGCPNEYGDKSSRVKDLNNFALLFLLSGIAPNLTEFSYWHSCAKQRLPMFQYQNWEAPLIESWQSCKFYKALNQVLLQRHQSARASLQSLSFSNKHLDLVELSMARFHQVTYLEISGDVRGYFGHRVDRFVPPFSLPSLHSVKVNFTGDLSSIMEDRLDQKLNEWFLELPPLKSIHFKDSCGLKTWDAVLEYHGATLRELRLDKSLVKYSSSGNERIYFAIKHIQMLQTCCPKLEDFCGNMPRSRGDLTEIEYYKAFAQFPRLKTLKLYLLTDWRRDKKSSSLAWPPSSMVHKNLAKLETTPYSEDSRTESGYPAARPTVVLAGHIRTTLINATVDKELAVAIANVIADSKVGVPLQSLKLHVSDFNPTEAGEFEPYIRFGGYQYHIQRDRITFSGSHHYMGVKKTTKKLRRSKLNVDKDVEPFIDLPLHRAIVESLWPGCWKSNRAIKRSVFSFPLQL